MTSSESRYLAYADAYSDRVAAIVRDAAALPAFTDRLAAAGMTSADVRDVHDLAALPVQSKEDVLEAQLAAPPFGGLLSPGAVVARVFQSPGPLYEPQLAGEDPWRWADAMRSAGVGENDLVLNCFGYHLSPAGAMFDEGSRAVGAAVLPGGIGSGELQARAIRDLPVTAYTGLPSYLKALVGHFAALGFDRSDWLIERAVVTAEPLPDSLRRELGELVPRIVMAYGTAEAGLLGYEDEPGGGLVVPDDVLVEICDLTTGQPVTEGEGQVVVTLFRPEYPLVRFGTGDLSAWTEGPDGGLRLAGVLGRAGQAVKVRGMFLHPAQATRVLDTVPGVTAFRIVVGRFEHRDTLRCEVVVDPGASSSSVLADAAHRIKEGLRFTCDVEAVDALPDDAQVISDDRDWS